MEKIIKIPIGSFYYEKFSMPIREKKDFIRLILDTLNLLDIGVYSDLEMAKGQMIIKVDKMSRIFYFLEDKYYSIVFPFLLEEKECIHNTYAVYDTVLDIEIDNRMISLMRSIVDKMDFINLKIESMLESIYYDMFEECSSEDIERCWNLLMRMFFIESGYIRYDYDTEHEKGDLHPLNHLDINYSAKCTYKFGLKEKIAIDDFVDLLNIQTRCRYVV